MKVNWDHPKTIAGLDLHIAPGEPFEMPDDEALARLDAGEIGLNAHDPEEHARLRAERAAPPSDQEPAPEVAAPKTTEESPSDEEAVSVAPRGRRRAQERTESASESEG